MVDATEKQQYAAVSLSRRAFAWLIDFALIIAGAVGIASWMVHYVSSLVDDVPGLTMSAADVFLPVATHEQPP